MKRIVVLAVLALTGSGMLPAHSLVDIDENNHVNARFRTANECITVYAWEAAYPYADVGSVQTEPGMWVDLYVQDADCGGQTRYFYAYSQYGDQALVLMDPTGSIALVSGLVSNEVEQLDVRLVFRADDDLPAVNPTVGPGPPTDVYSATGRNGTATATFEGAGLSLADVASEQANSWSSHWANLG